LAMIMARFMAIFGAADEGGHLHKR